MTRAALQLQGWWLVWSPNCQWKSLWFPRSRPRRTSNFSVMISVVTQGDGCPYYKGSAIFSLVFFLSTTSEKSFFSAKTLPLCKPLRFVQFGQESCLQWWSRVLNFRVRVPQKTSSTSTDIEKCTRVRVPYKNSSTSTFTSLEKEIFKL